jgi:hypothetical protein
VIAIPIERKQIEEALAAMQQQPGQALQGDVFVFGGPGGGPGGEIGDRMPNNILLDYGLPLGSALFDWTLRGLVLFGLAWALGGRPAPGAMLRLNGWTLIPGITHLIVLIAVMLASGRVPTSGLGSPAAAMSTGPGVAAGPGFTFTAEAGPGGPAGPVGAGEPVRPSLLRIVWGSFLQTVDVYRLWEIALLAVGVAVVARLGWLKAIVPPLAYWALAVVLAVLPIVLMPLLAPFLFGGPMIVR